MATMARAQGPLVLSTFRGVELPAFESGIADARVFVGATDAQPLVVCSASGGEPHHLLLRPSATGLSRVLCVEAAETAQITDAAVSTSPVCARQLAVACGDGTVRTYCCTTGTICASASAVTVGAAPPTSVAWRGGCATPGVQLLAVGHSDGSIFIYESTVSSLTRVEFAAADIHTSGSALNCTSEAAVKLLSFAPTNSVVIAAVQEGVDKASVFSVNTTTSTARRVGCGAFDSCRNACALSWPVLGAILTVRDAEGEDFSFRLADDALEAVTQW